IEPDARALETWIAATKARISAPPTRMTKASSFMQAAPGAVSFPGGKFIHPQGLPGLPEATTDSSGRFRLTGLGNDRKVVLVVEGPGLATAWIAAVTRDMQPIPMTFADPRFASSHYFGSKFDFPAEPSQTIEGVVRDADSRQPLAGAQVLIRRFGGSTVMLDEIGRASCREG